MWKIRYKSCYLVNFIKKKNFTQLWNKINTSLLHKQIHTFISVVPNLCESVASCLFHRKTTTHFLKGQTMKRDKLLLYYKGCQDAASICNPLSKERQLYCNVTSSQEESHIPGYRKVWGACQNTYRIPWPKWNDQGPKNKELSDSSPSLEGFICLPTYVKSLCHTFLD